MNIFMMLAIVVVFSIGNAQAAFQEVVREFLETNLNINSNNIDMKKSELGIDKVEAQNDIFLNLIASQTNEEPVGFFSFQQNDTKTTYYSLGLSKRTLWGGQFDLSQEIYSYDLTKWATPPSSGDTPYQVQNTVKYTQDLGANFFGLSYRYDHKVAEKQKEYTNLSLSSANQNLLLSFFSNYLNTKLEKTLVELNRESEQRASQRRSVIAKRVKDGLSKKVDLYQAQIAELTQKETLRARQRSYFQSLNDLATKLHRPIVDSEMSHYNLDKIQLLQKVDGPLEANLDLRATEEALELARYALKKAKRSYYPKISLSGSYSAVAINDDFGDAYSDGNYGGDREKTVVSLNVSIPLGADLASAESAEKSYELNKSEMKLSKLRRDLITSIDNLEIRIKLIKEEIELSKDKREIAKKALKEQNRLYLLGQKDLDEVIRSEETLIQTEINLSSAITLYSVLLAEYAGIKGKLLGFTYTFRD